jgi:hypothetical protein
MCEWVSDDASDTRLHIVFCPGRWNQQSPVIPPTFVFIACWLTLIHIQTLVEGPQWALIACRFEMFWQPNFVCSFDFFTQTWFNRAGCLLVGHGGTYTLGKALFRYVMKGSASVWVCQMKAACIYYWASWWKTCNCMHQIKQVLHNDTYCLLRMIACHNYIYSHWLCIIFASRTAQINCVYGPCVVFDRLSW